MGRILLAASALLGLFLLSWLVCSALGVLTPDATGAWLSTLGSATAVLAVAGLLAADFALPVPGSIVLSAGGIVLGWPVAAAAGCAGLVLGGLILCCLARLAGMRTSRFLLALLLGSAPYAWFFAWAGDRLGRVREEPGLALVVALVVPALYWCGFAVFAGWRRAGR